MPVGSYYANIDYRKWDNIELSDDEDFECHPNVDKKSMVRWKQAQVHKERRQRQDQRDLLRLELSQTKIFIDFLPKQLDRFKGLNNAQILIKLEELAKEVNDKFTEPMRKESLQRMENWPGNWEPPVWGDVLRNHVPWNEELQNIGKSLETKLDQDLFSILSLEFQKTIEKFTERSKIVEQEIENVEKIMGQKLTMDSLVTGFDKTFVNEQKSSATLADAEPVEKQKVATIETIHTPKLLSSKHQLEVFEEMESTDDDLVRLNKNLLNLSKLSDYGKIASLLKQDPTLLNEKNEEVLLLRALCLEIISQSKEAKNAVMVSMIIKFIRNLGVKGIDVFFQRLSGTGSSAQNLFFQDLDKTYKHINSRAKILLKEKQDKIFAEKEQELAREKIYESFKHADGTLRIPLGENPTENELKQAEWFDNLPEYYKEGLLKEDIDKINQYLSSLEPEEAEYQANLAVKAGFIQFQEEEESDK